jgi:hypothetical protein
MSKTNNNNSLKKLNINEKIKTKYVLASAIKTNKISSKLIKTSNNVVSDKTFIGYDETDYDSVEKICNLDDVNLVVKGKSHFISDISCQNNVNIKNKTIIGSSDEKDITKLNSDTNLHVKGDTEINGNLYITQNLNSDKNINVLQSLNVGFEKNISDNTAKLNVNGNSEFVGNNVIYGSEYIKNNLVVNDKATFYNDIFLTNSISLKKESFDNIVVTNNSITLENKDSLIKSIISELLSHSQQECSVLKFYSKKNTNINSGLLSVSKKIIIKKEKYLIFVLAYAIYSNYKIINVNPLLDTFTMVNSKELIIKISENNKNTNNIERNKIDDKNSNKNSDKNKDTVDNLPIISTNITKLADLFKKSFNSKTEDSSSSEFFSDESDKSDKKELDDFIIETTYNFTNKSETSNEKEAEIKKDSLNNENLKDDTEKVNKNIKDDFNLKIFDFSQKLKNENNKKISTYIKNNNNSENDFDSDIDLDAFEVIK